MALTTRTNGSGPSNIIQASWWNEYKDLLTGVMQDQLVTLTQNLVLQAIGGPPGSAPTLNTASGSNLGVGTYKYAVTFNSANGESLVGPAGTVTTTSGNRNVSVSAIATGPTGTVSRNIYRSKVNNTSLFLLTTLNDNSTTTYTDSTSDASLSSTANPSHSTFGGSVLLKDNTGDTKLQIAQDGAFLTGISLNPTPTTVSGSTSGTASLYQPMNGILKLVIVLYSNFKNGSAGDIDIAIPIQFNQHIIGLSGDTGQFSLKSAGNARTVWTHTGLPSSGGNSGTTVSTTTLHSLNIFHVDQSVDTVTMLGSQSGTANGMLILIGR